MNFFTQLFYWSLSCFLIGLFGFIMVFDNPFGWLFITILLIVYFLGLKNIIEDIEKEYEKT